MAVVHSTGNHKACDIMMEEVIVVTATVSTDQIRFKVKGIAGFSKPADHPGGRLYPVSQTKGFCLKINRGTCKERGFFAGFFDFIEFSQCTFVMEAANLSGYDAGFRNNVGRRASLYGADIHGRVSDPATGDRINGMCSSFDGVDSVFRRKGSMGSPSVENCFERKNRRCLTGSSADRPRQIKYIGFL